MNLAVIVGGSVSSDFKSSSNFCRAVLSSPTKILILLVDKSVLLRSTNGYKYKELDKHTIEKYNNFVSFIQQPRKANNQNNIFCAFKLTNK